MSVACPHPLLACCQYLKRQREAEGGDTTIRLTQLASQSGVPRPEGVRQKLVPLLRKHGRALGLCLSGKGSDLALSLADAEGAKGAYGNSSLSSGVGSLCESAQDCML